MKQTHHNLPTPDLKEVCTIEKARHGDGDLNPHFFTFGNAAMDAYLNQPGPANQVWQYFQMADGVCRGAYLYLLVQAHPNFLADHLAPFLATASEEEQVFVLRCWRQFPNKSLAGLLPNLLQNSDIPAVRKEAANHFGTWAERTHPSEAEMLALLQGQASEVIQQAIWSLDVKSFSDSFWLQLLQYPDVEVQEACLLVLNQGQEKHRKLAEDQANQSEYPQIQALARDLANREKPLAMKVTVSGYPTKNPSPACLCDAKYLLLQDQIEAFLKDPIAETDLLRMDPEGEIPLFELALYGSSETLFYLLEVQPEWIKAATPDGQTLLMTLVQGFYQTSHKNAKPCYAQPEESRYKRVDLMQKTLWLLDHGAPINQQDAAGRTALFIAVFADKSEMIHLLISNGADPDLRDWDGTSARMLGQLMDQTWMD
ncbi:MAG: ankyrin repeat domain-containing protein [Acidobacteria bacterium]|nr:ankyrin repeat domain-containing protein [Acidobacteriota bacterium]